MLSIKDIVGKSVVTESGQYLGRVICVYIDERTQEIEQYEVRTGKLIPTGKHFFIHRKQVVRITKENIIVEDNIVPQGDLLPAVDVEI